MHSQAEKSVILVLAAGEAITLLADVRESGLVDVECEEGVVTVFHRDLLGAKPRSRPGCPDIPDCLAGIFNRS